MTAIGRERLWGAWAQLPFLTLLQQDLARMHRCHDRVCCHAPSLLVQAPAAGLLHPRHPRPPGTIELVPFPREQVPDHATGHLHQPRRPRHLPLRHNTSMRNPVQYKTLRASRSVISLTGPTRTCTFCACPDDIRLTATVRLVSWATRHSGEAAAPQTTSNGETHEAKATAQT